MPRISWNPLPISSPRIFLSRLFWIFRLPGCRHRMGRLRYWKVGVRASSLTGLDLDLDLGMARVLAADR